MELVPFLVNASSEDPNVRQPAELQLRNLEQQNWALYLNSLCNVLANQQVQPLPRRLAGLLLKNAIVSKDEQKQFELAQKWLLLEVVMRQNIQQLILRTLHDPMKDVRSTAALVIGKVAAIEVPKGNWPNVIEQLVANITDGSSSADTKQASFEALGFVCEECRQFIQDKSSQILNAIAVGMYKDQTNNAIKLAATNALSNSLDFVRNNFANEQERHQIMAMVFQVAVSEDFHVRVAAFSCIVEIAATYYDFLPAYIKDIFMLTGKAISTDKEEVALQAVEFWSTVCDEEKARIEEAEEAQNKGIQTRVCHSFAKNAMPNLLPLILNCLTKQSEEVDDDTWNVAQAAGTCLSLFAQTVRDEVVPIVLQFVEANITNANWRFREAATLSFGCILDGPSQDKLKPLVIRAFTPILSFFRDPQPHVKDTAVWTVGRICDVLPDIINEDLLPVLMANLLQSLDDAPQIAAHVCWAVHNLAGAVEVDSSDDTSPLSKYFEPAVGKLLMVSERNDAGNTNLIPSAYEAINSMVANSAADCLPLIEKMLPVLKERLKKSLFVQAFSIEERDRLYEIQGLLCGTLQNIIDKLEASIIEPLCDELMQCFLHVLQVKNSLVHEESFMAIGSIANKLEGGFLKYTQSLVPFLIQALQNPKEHQACIVAIGLIGDVSRAIEAQLAPFCDSIMQLLLQNLSNNDIAREIKPHTVSCIGDVAMAIGQRFERYLPFVMMLFMNMSQQVLAEHEQTLDNIDFINQSRASIFEAYTGILQGLHSGNKIHLFVQFLNQATGLLQLVAQDRHHDELVLSNAIGFIGDAASMVGQAASLHLKTPVVKALLDEALSLDNDRLKERASWAIKFVQEL